LLNCVFAKYLGLEPGELVYFGWDAHIYQNQIEMCEEQIKRKPMDLPILKIHRSLDTFEDMLNLEYGTDVELMCYDPLPDLKNKPPMAV
jgi:thymidylate synthase